MLGSNGKGISTAADFLVSEHGIYTREREEELIKAKWVNGIYKNIWIDQVSKKCLSLPIRKAVLLQVFLKQARQLQIELGCPPEKIVGYAEWNSCRKICRTSQESCRG